ncbi:serine hydrolase domain-containing protein [Aeromicrobium ginsengisoli]|uniref:Beta-lactamase family protein n=1 Tax=Aeromicrobium ginsengisoli TaxID=363867 RepID=A0A5M4FCX5_9ACTN|nr:serine hydrolase domain-containing protein [Aeromicrobium ginsengisoli]KAA1397109.1 beta-lactamase family protein [Aeromicrobium ginsengisoli]
MSIPTVEDPQEVGLDPAALQRLTASVRADIDSGLHHGAVMLVARAGRIGYLQTLGHTDLDLGRDASADDLFMLMSTAKSYTAVLVLQAVDRGALTFDTKVAEIIPEFGIRGKQNVTVAHLLTHTGGTWAGFVPPPPHPWGPVWGDLETMTAAICAQQLANRPGERVVYNPFASFGILGEIVRRLDPKGRRFLDIAREELFEPLGMLESSFGLALDHPRRVPLRMAETTPGAAAVSVMESLNDIVDENFELPAGMAFSSIGDVFTFAEMLRNRGSGHGVRLLSPAIVDYAFKNHTGDKPNDFWDFNKEARGLADFPANFTYGGGYARGSGDYMSPFGLTASPRTFGSVGSGSTMWMVDPERDVTFIFLSSGLLEGLHHFTRLQRLADLALAAVND